jgi:dihydroorotate dehydrogenase
VPGADEAGRRSVTDREASSVILEYARKLEDAGVDALECNFFASPKEPERTAAEIEDEQVETIARQTVSVLFRDGPEHIRAMAGARERWMETQGYKTLADFRGKLSRRHVNDPWAYTRAQYARLLMNTDEVVKNFTA